MTIEIPRSGTFRRALKSGINLFTGAGFSVLPDKNGKRLPTGGELADEVSARFGIKGSTLEQIATLAQKKYPEDLQAFLRDRLRVDDYNELYKKLWGVSLESYITTNTDNLFELVLADAPDRYLHNSVNCGPCKRNGKQIPYYPLHGSVNDMRRPLAFSESSIAGASSDNPYLFTSMQSMLRQAPTLFWGYGFHDSSVKSIVSNILLDTQHSPIWVLLMPGDPQIDYLRELGLNVIVGDTQQLLEWIGQEIGDVAVPTEASTLQALSQYVAPPDSVQEAVTWESYIVEGMTNWSSVIHGIPYITETMRDMEDFSERHQNVIGLGLPFCGKTTLLMWMAKENPAPLKLMMARPTLAEAQFVTRKLGRKRAVVYVDDCASDIEALAHLVNTPNVRVVAVANDFDFESSRHLLPADAIKTMDISELRECDAQGMFQHIPSSIRTPYVTYLPTVVRDGRRERFSMIEMIARNVERAPWRNRIKATLEQLKAAGNAAFETVVLAVFLEEFGSALNTDVLFAYFPEVRSYQDSLDLVNAVRSCLAPQGVELIQDKNDQDYYYVRSHLFADEMWRLLRTPEYLNDLEDVMGAFFENVDARRIYRNYEFRRRAHDADLFYRVFEDRGGPVYESLRHMAAGTGEEPHILQQWALYLAKQDDFEGAFPLIDEATRLRPQNQSIHNARAVILFKANRKVDTPTAHDSRLRAMGILTECIQNDRRKVYHTQVYGEYACILAEEHGDASFLGQAERNFETLASQEGYLSYRSREIQNRIAKNLGIASKLHR